MLYAPALVQQNYMLLLAMRNLAYFITINKNINRRRFPAFRTAGLRIASPAPVPLLPPQPACVPVKTDIFIQGSNAQDAISCI